MKKATYILCLIATWFAGELIASKIITIFVNSLIKNEILIISASFLIKIFSSAIPILAAYRFLIFIKSRSIIIPDNFSGLTYAIGLIATAPVLITAAGYIILAIKGTNGLSGVPLGFISIGAACIGIIPVVYCEAKAFYSSIPARNA